MIPATGVPQNYVADANVLFSMLISGRTDYLLFLAQNRVYTSDFALEEIRTYQQRILSRSKLAGDQLLTYVLDLFNKLTVVPNLVISSQSYYQAYTYCRDIDLNDIDYVALSLQLNLPLLTRDKPLVEGLRQKGFINIITLDELFGQGSPSGSAR